MLLTVAALASGVRGAETILGVPAEIMQVSDEQEPGIRYRFEHSPEEKERLKSMSREELEKLIGQVQKQMKAAAADLNFEMAAELRDKMIELKKSLDDLKEM